MSEMVAHLGVAIERGRLTGAFGGQRLAREIIAELRKMGYVIGPEDPRDPSVNDIIDSEEGEDSEEGFDDMPYEAGWDDGDFDPEDEEDEDE